MRSNEMVAITRAAKKADTIESAEPNAILGTRGDDGGTGENQEAQGILMRILGPEKTGGKDETRNGKGTLPIREAQRGRGFLRGRTGRGRRGTAAGRTMKAGLEQKRGESDGSRGSERNKQRSRNMGRGPTKGVTEELDEPGNESESDQSTDSGEDSMKEGENENSDEDLQEESKMDTSLSSTDNPEETLASKKARWRKRKEERRNAKEEDDKRMEEKEEMEDKEKEKKDIELTTEEDDDKGMEEKEDMEDEGMKQDDREHIMGEAEERSGEGDIEEQGEGMDEKEGGVNNDEESDDTDEYVRKWKENKQNEDRAEEKGRGTRSGDGRRKVEKEERDEDILEKEKQEKARIKKERRRLSNRESKRRQREREKMQEKERRKDEKESEKEKYKAKQREEKKRRVRLQKEEAKNRRIEQDEPTGLPQRWDKIKLRKPIKMLTEAEIGKLLKLAKDRMAADDELDSKEKMIIEQLRDVRSGKAKRQKEKIEERENLKIVGVYSPSALSTKTPPEDKQGTSNIFKRLTLPEHWVALSTEELKSLLGNLIIVSTKYGLTEKEEKMKQQLHRMIQARTRAVKDMEREREEEKQKGTEDKRKKKFLQEKAKKEKELEEKRRKMEHTSRKNQERKITGSGKIRQVTINSSMSSEYPSDKEGVSPYDDQKYAVPPHWKDQNQANEEEEDYEYEKLLNETMEEHARRESIEEKKADIREDMLRLEERNDLMSREEELRKGEELLKKKEKKIEEELKRKYEAKEKYLKEKQDKLEWNEAGLDVFNQAAAYLRHQATTRRDNETEEEKVNRLAAEKIFRDQLLEYGFTNESWVKLQDEAHSEELARQVNEKAAEKEKARKEREAKKEEGNKKEMGDGQEAKDDKGAEKGEEKAELKEKARKTILETPYKRGSKDAVDGQGKSTEWRVMTSEERKNRIQALDAHQITMAQHYGDTFYIRNLEKPTYYPYTKFEKKRMECVYETAVHEQTELEQEFELKKKPSTDTEIKVLKRALATALAGIMGLQNNFNSLATMHDQAMTEMMTDTVVWRGSGMTVLEPEWKIAQLFMQVISKISQPPSLKEQLEPSCFSFKWGVAEDIRLDGKTGAFETCRDKSAMQQTDIWVRCQLEEAARWIRVKVNEFYERGGNLGMPFAPMRFLRAWGPGARDMQEWIKGMFKNVKIANEKMREQGMKPTEGGRKLVDVIEIELAGTRKTDFLLSYSDETMEAVSYWTVPQHPILQHYIPKLNNGTFMPQPLDLSQDYTVMQNHNARMNAANFGLEKMEYNVIKDHEGTLAEEKYWRQRGVAMRNVPENTHIYPGGYGMKFTSTRHRPQKYLPKLTSSQQPDNRRSTEKSKQIATAEKYMKERAEEEKKKEREKRDKDEKDRREEERKLEKEKRDQAKKAQKEDGEKEQVIQKEIEADVLLEKVLQKLGEQEKSKVDIKTMVTPKTGRKRRVESPEREEEEEGERYEGGSHEQLKRKAYTKRGRYSPPPIYREELRERRERGDMMMMSEGRDRQMDPRDAWIANNMTQPMALQIEHEMRMREPRGRMEYRAPGYPIGQPYGGGRYMDPSEFEQGDIYRNPHIYRKY